MSLIAALKAGNFVRAHDFFRFWQPSLVQDVVGRMLAAAITTGDVIVIDNASFHRSQNIDEIVSAGCEIWYLPPYSPDLMP
ncbi:transposase [Microcoleus sp. FACHB-831]|uniref:transposase n=1 Tax=Microcoleus sp. FACHB-831 TaxID=2692827 RepID=UPI002815FD86|nr:transposase [Microcoleus sp. FACHB-831]